MIYVSIKKKWFCIDLLVPSTMVEVLKVVIQYDDGTYMTYPWCMHLHEDDLMKFWIDIA